MQSCSRKGEGLKGWREKEKGQIIHNEHGTGHVHDDECQMTNGNELVGCIRLIGFIG